MPSTTMMSTARRFVDPEQLICPGCREQVRPLNEAGYEQTYDVDELRPGCRPRPRPTVSASRPGHPSPSAAAPVKPPTTRPFGS